MKNRLLSFCKKYWLCFLLSVIYIIGLALTDCFADAYISGNGTIKFNLNELYRLFFVPLFALLYGCLSFVVSKNPWLPQLIFFVFTFAYWFGFDIKNLAWLGTYFWTVYPLVLSFLGTGITALIYCVIKAIKHIIKTTKEYNAQIE